MSRDPLSLGWCVHGSTGWMRVSLTALEDFLASGRNSGVVPAYHHSLRFGWYKLASSIKISRLSGQDYGHDGRITLRTSVISVILY